jgi:lipopolysaccharide export system protein LptA
MRAIRIPALLAIAISAVAIGHPAFAQSANSGLKLSNDKPIQIESDNLELREQEKKALFKGNVRVAQGAMTLHAASMTVYYKGGTQSIAAGGSDIDRIEVSGNVKLTSATQSATADNGNINMVSEVLVLNGSKSKPVVLSEGGNVFKGCKLTVQMKSGLANLDGCGRVQILIDPKSN